MTDQAVTETADPAHAEATDAPHAAAGEAHHPRPSAYVGIAIILAIVTALEVGLYYVDDLDDWVVTTTLIVMMAVKFFLVATWFMHLRFEAPVFRTLFYGGLTLAMAAYAVFLGASGVFPFID
ncbi:MAG TPA: cytochrome C oxidase subunit IV family protein [Acidimicrobiia bacterium]|nr:cytochrome C oxidase subunit IV family protein [Acidimicrobiia bacterium]